MGRATPGPGARQALCPTRTPDTLGDELPADVFGPEDGAAALQAAEALLSWACLLPTRGVSGANQGSARQGHQQPFTSNSQAQLGVLLRIFIELIPFPHGGAPRDGGGRITGTPPPKKKRARGQNCSIFRALTMAIGGMLKRLGFPIALLAATACTVISAGDADAVLVYELIQQGSDVTLNVSGSLTGLPTGASASRTGPSLIGPGLAIIASGSFAGTTYTTSGPTNFGSGGPNLISYSGDPFSFAFGTSLLLSSTYGQGSPITGSGLISGQTLASLGLSSTSGLLGTWTVGSDSIEVWAGAKPAATVPGPLPLFGAGVAFAYSRRLRARVRAGSASQA